MKRKSERMTTARFGEVVYSQDDVYTFPKGLVGLPALRRFVMLTLDETGIFRCLQSIDNTDFAFVVVDPLFVRADYRVPIDAARLADIELSDLSDAVVLGIVVVPEDPSKMTVNLRGPLLVNAKTRAGVQLVLSNSEFSVREPVTEPLPSEEHELHT